ncbi:MAG: twin-arginine translocation signal domain-containing protein, partial [Verrucomicrobiota bacterium]|nr:twin-arginine translocation signal domain-containing protein [Verrucomicrobiota bacterium]
MKTSLSRRRFVKSSAAAGAAAAVAFPSILHAKDTQKKITVGVIGLSRGLGHLRKYM